MRNVRPLSRSAEMFLVEVLRDDGMTARRGKWPVVATPLYIRDAADPIRDRRLAEVGESDGWVVEASDTQSCARANAQLVHVPDGLGFGRIPARGHAALRGGSCRFRSCKRLSKKSRVCICCRRIGNACTTHRLARVFRSVLHPALRVTARAVEQIPRSPSGSLRIRFACELTSVGLISKMIQKFADYLHASSNLWSGRRGRTRTSSG